LRDSHGGSYIGSNIAYTKLTICFLISRLVLQHVFYLPALKHLTSAGGSIPDTSLGNVQGALKGLLSPLGGNKSKSPPLEVTFSFPLLFARNSAAVAASEPYTSDRSKKWVLAFICQIMREVSCELNFNLECKVKQTHLLHCTKTAIISAL
jgi:hypothetical protein